MFGSAAKFNHMRQTAAKAGEPIEVTAEQLEELFKADGMKASDIKMHLNISKIMGGSVLIGDKLFKLKEEKTESCDEKEYWKDVREHDLLKSYSRSQVSSAIKMYLDKRGPLNPPEMLFHESTEEMAKTIEKWIKHISKNKKEKKNDKQAKKRGKKAS